MKIFLVISGLLSALLVLAQLVMGLLIAGGQQQLRTAHQHSGYTMVVVCLLYIGFSLATILSTPKRVNS
ncbi:MAG: hypothetical protein U0835_25565 [Isosphaeraceae bacterium]